jgi:hypothetical protein
MTPQERQLLANFLQQLAQTRADPKDPEADALIRDALSRQPDANYLLVQRAMGLDLALKAAQAQIEELQAEPDEAKRGKETSFVGNANAWGRSAPAANAAQQPLPPLGQGYGKTVAPAAAGAAAPSAWGSGMLGNLATTAAGVVAGSFLYQGIQNLMGHHSSGLGSGSDWATGSQAAASGSNDALTPEEAADAVDDSDNSDSDTSVAMDDGGFDSSDLG